MLTAAHCPLIVESALKANIHVYPQAYEYAIRHCRLAPESKAPSTMRCDISTLHHTQHLEEASFKSGQQHASFAGGEVRCHAVGFKSTFIRSDHRQPCCENVSSRIPRLP